MKIAIFGATGPTGLHVVDLALKEGYDVVAYARNASKLLKFPNLEIVVGQLDNYDLISSTINGVDAVISLLGPKFKIIKNQLIQGMQNIIQAMKEHSVKRLIASSTISVVDPKDEYSFKHKFLVFMIKTLLRAQYNEVIKMTEEILSSDLDWSSFRLVVLTNGNKSHQVHVGYLGRDDISLRIARVNVAHFVLDELKSGNYIHQCPVISN